mmetsp:Transcript_14561/g.43618  ORF Transcript_14561/g.43618 Transcript_14561/m.43618 type:complete len:627 (-) Transcript_14561:71-1951(-)
MLEAAHGVLGGVGMDLEVVGAQLAGPLRPPEQDAVPGVLHERRHDAPGPPVGFVVHERVRGHNAHRLRLAPGPGEVPRGPVEREEQGGGQRGGGDHVDAHGDHQHQRLPAEGVLVAATPAIAPAPDLEPLVLEDHGGADHPVLGGLGLPGDSGALRGDHLRHQQVEHLGKLRVLLVDDAASVEAPVVRLALFQWPLPVEAVDVKRGVLHDRMEHVGGEEREPRRVHKEVALGRDDRPVAAGHAGAADPQPHDPGDARLHHVRDPGPQGLQLLAVHLGEPGRLQALPLATDRLQRLAFAGGHHEEAGGVLRAIEFHGDLRLRAAPGREQHRLLAVVDARRAVDARLLGVLQGGDPERVVGDDGEGAVSGGDVEALGLGGRRSGLDDDAAVLRRHRQTLGQVLEAEDQRLGSQLEGLRRRHGHQAGAGRAAVHLPDDALEPRALRHADHHLAAEHLRHVAHHGRDGDRLRALLDLDAAGAHEVPVLDAGRDLGVVPLQDLEVAVRQLQDRHLHVGGQGDLLLHRHGGVDEADDGHVDQHDGEDPARELLQLEASRRRHRDARLRQVAPHLLPRSSGRDDARGPALGQHARAVAHRNISELIRLVVEHGRGRLDVIAGPHARVGRDSRA